MIYANVKYIYYIIIGCYDKYLSIKNDINHP